jgi:hypothetical protein
VAGKQALHILSSSLFIHHSYFPAGFLKIKEAPTGLFSNAPTTKSSVELTAHMNLVVQ